jgi:phosphoribosylaminoimidazolecarboxamide formyltransferase/IMP cyclohydrolase
MEISFYDDQQRQTLVYEKVEWVVDGERKGLRYGENPDQEAAFYRLVNGNLCLGDVECIRPGLYLASDLELLQSGKHPGKINITDADSALNILRYFTDTPCAVIMKHNNPCGVALGGDLHEAYTRAYLADRLAAFGGAVALNGPVDRATAEAISESYIEVLVAPEFEDGAISILSRRKNLRIMRIANMNRLADFIGKRVIDPKSLIDGGLVVQWSYVPKALSATDLTVARTRYKGSDFAIEREPNEAEYRDMIFGWLVESGVTSNSILYVKDGVTVGIGTGEQDRVGAAEIARDKAYRKLADRIAWERHGKPLYQLDEEEQEESWDQARNARGGLPGSVMVSDAFFPFRDGIDVGLAEGVTAVIQPGGSLRDFESIQACNESGATMTFTGQRSFRH